MDERYRIIKQIFNTFFFSVIAFIIGSSRVFIIGRNFSPAETGAYDQILRIISIGIYLFGLNLYSFMYRFVPGEEEKRKIILYKTLLLLEISTAFVFIFVIFILRGDSYFCNLVKISEYQNILRLGLFIVIVQILATDFGRFFSAVKEIEFSNLISFFNSSFWIIALLILWGMGIRITLPMFFLIWVGGSSITIFLGLQKIGFLKFLKSKIDTSLIKKAYAFSVPLVLSSLGYNLVSMSSSFILSHYHTPSATGMYFIAYRPLTMIYEFVTAVGITVFIPYIVEAHNVNDTEKKNYYLSIMTKYTFIAALPIVMGILIGRADLIKFISRPEYSNAASIVPYFVIMPIIYIFLYPAHYTLYLENRTKLLGITYFMFGLINVALNILLVPKYTYYGAASATILSLLLVFIVFHLMTLKRLHLRWNFIKVWRIIFVSLISGGISYILYNSFSDFSIEFVRLILLGIIILILFISGLYLFSVFEPKETNILKGIYRKVLSKL